MINQPQAAIPPQQTSRNYQRNEQSIRIDCFFSSVHVQFRYEFFVEQFNNEFESIKSTKSSNKRVQISRSKSNRTRTTSHGYQTKSTTTVLSTECRCDK